LVIPGIVTPIAIMNTPTTFDTFVGIWVDHANYLNYSDGSNPWVTPAQIQASRLGELLRTRAFQSDVAKRVPALAPLVGSPTGDGRIDDLLAKTVTLNRVGDHILSVGVLAPNAQLSYDLANAIVNAYQEKNAADDADQANA